MTRKSKLSTKTRKLTRVAKAEKLKFPGNKDQFIFNSKLSGTLDEVSTLLAAQKTEKAEEKLAELTKSLKRRQKIIKLADKSEAGWLAVKENHTEELASDSEVKKRICKAQERALKKKKQNASKKAGHEKKLVSWHFLFCTTNDDFFEVLSLLFLCISTGKCSHSACRYIVVMCFTHQCAGEGKLFSSLLASLD